MKRISLMSWVALSLTASPNTLPVLPVAPQPRAVSAPNPGGVTCSQPGANTPGGQQGNNRGFAGNT